ncbi:MAG: DUF3536 domain-containing protein [Candidatus Omnitrophota bacterium]
MNKYICIHGHFYQPPRENPWLEEVERQDSAYPYHDWNERIADECYAPNSAARILDSDGKITGIMSNYSNISYNFGPTLLSWMEKNDPDLYKSVIESDLKSRELFSGHGSALAQCYNHMIMPLANYRDRRTQVLWGIKDFEKRFGRRPEGMWLPETAADNKTLEILADENIKFTILAPRQAKRVKKMDGSGRWKNVSDGKIDPRQAYLCKLPSGKEINLFFYDGPISQSVAFEKVLLKGEYLADRLMEAFTDKDIPQLVNIATDGETYGHHQEKSDMALAYCIEHIRKNNLAKITIYGEYLEQFPPVFEVEIHENSSWSCIHGVERWKNDCGCNSGMHGEWNQAWRAPLRGALDWLRDNISEIFEREMKPFNDDPWTVRDKYIDLILERTPENISRFIRENAGANSDEGSSTKFLKLLEMQRHSMLMYTSCGWFFDEVSAIETVQIIQYAARTMQLAADITGIPLEDTFISLLEKVPSNIPEYGNTVNVYDKFVKPAVLDLERVVAHFAISSLFEEYGENTRVYCFNVKKDMISVTKVGHTSLVCGKVEVVSNITLQRRAFVFAVVHLGSHNFFAGVRSSDEIEDYKSVIKRIEETFKKSDVAGTLNLIKRNLGPDHYSLWHLFKDEQHKVLYQIIDTAIDNIESLLRKMNEDHYPIIQVIREMNIPMPKVMGNIFTAMVNTELVKSFEEHTLNIDHLKQLTEKVIEWNIDIDRVTLEFLAQMRINQLSCEFRDKPLAIEPIKKIKSILLILAPLGLNINLWKTQNILFYIGEKMFDDMKVKASLNEPEPVEWVDVISRLGEMLKVEVG